MLFILELRICLGSLGEWAMLFGLRGGNWVVEIICGRNLGWRGVLYFSFL